MANKDLAKIKAKTYAKINESAIMVVSYWEDGNFFVLPLSESTSRFWGFPEGETVPEGAYLLSLFSFDAGVLKEGEKKLVINTYQGSREVLCNVAVESWGVIIFILEGESCPIKLPENPNLERARKLDLFLEQFTTYWISIVESLDKITKTIPTIAASAVLVLSSMIVVLDNFDPRELFDSSKPEDIDVKMILASEVGQYPDPSPLSLSIWKYEDDCSIVKLESIYGTIDAEKEINYLSVRSNKIGVWFKMLSRHRLNLPFNSTVGNLGESDFKDVMRRSGASEIATSPIKGSDNCPKGFVLATFRDPLDQIQKKAATDRLKVTSQLYESTI